MPSPSVPLSAIRQPAILYDADGRVVAANDLADALAGRRLAGCTAPDMARIFRLRRPDGTLLSPGELPCGRALAGEEVAGFPLSVTAAGGRTIDVLATASPIRDGDAVTGALLVWQDVTDQREAEVALHESEERLRDVLDLSLDVLYRRDLVSGRFDYLSPVNETLTGFTAGEFGAFSLAELMAHIHPDDRARADAIVIGATQAACTRISGMIEYRFRHRDGRYRWLSDHFIIQAGPDGRPGHRVGVIRDVTRRREIEAALQEREERLNLALDAAVIGTFDWNIATGEETWDDRVRMQWDLPSGASVTHAIFEAGIHPDDLPAVLDAIGRALDPAGDGQYAAEYRVIGLCDGVERRITSQGRTYFDGGRPVRMIGTTVDVTEQRRTEQALQRYAERLAASNEELQRFAYVASHDLQEPLRSIVSFSQLLERRYQGRLDSDADEFIGFIVEGGIRMQRLIQDLLAFSRVETMAGTPVETDPREAMEAARSLLGASLAEACARLEIGALPAVVVDPPQLEQVFANLVGNAVKYRHPDRPLAIAIGARRLDGMVEFAVQDNGIGIEKEYFDQIFEMFRRLHTKDQYEGTGIGLAIVKRIIDRHGGAVRIESTPGEGSTFFFTLPAA